MQKRPIISSILLTKATTYLASKRTSSNAQDTHAHSLVYSLSPVLYLSLSPPHLSLTRSHTSTHARTHARTHAHITWQPSLQAAMPNSPTHTYTHTHTLSLSLSLSPTHIHTIPENPAYKQQHPRRHSRCRDSTMTYTPTHTNYLAAQLTPSNVQHPHPHTLSLFVSLSRTHTRSRTIPGSLAYTQM